VRADHYCLESADLFIAGQLTGEAEFLVGPLLRAELEDDAVAIDSVTDRLAFCDAHGQRLFVIHVLAIVGGFDAYQRMPMIGRHDRHCVDVFSSEQFAEIAIDSETLAAVMPLDSLDGPFAEHLAQIAGSDGLHVVVSEERSQMPAPHAADAYKSHSDFLARRHGSVCAEHL